MVSEQTFSNLLHFFQKFRKKKKMPSKGLLYNKRVLTSKEGYDMLLLDYLNKKI